MQVGDLFTYTRVLTQDDFNRFAKLSGDDNPIHVDPEFCARTRFGKTVAHGMFLYSLICRALHTHLPGAEPISQDLMFPTPSFAGEQITVSVRVLQMQPEERTARLETIVTRPNGELGCQGETRVRWQV
jgi:acyl dehydratase